ncbi:MAG: PH domain-containing protein, partial [Patescibacteria group bacterium]
MILPAVLLTSTLGLLPPFVVWGVNAVDLGVDGPGAAVGIAITSAFYLTLATYFYIRWLDYYLDVGVVTDKRVVDIDQLGLFRRNVDELDCKVIQDVTVSRHGFLQTIFNFGNLEIQTAGERRNFEFRGIPNPEEIQHLV